MGYTVPILSHSKVELKLCGDDALYVKASLRHVWSGTITA